MAGTINLLQAVLEAILESDNELGGYLRSTLRGAHRRGRNDGVLHVGSAQLQSPELAFLPGDVGRLVDVLDQGGTNFGTYQALAVNPTGKLLTLQTVDGLVPVFADETGVRWRWADMAVSGIEDFPERDPEQKVYVGFDPDPTYYAAVDHAPGAQQLRGLGAHTYCDHGQILVASPTHLSTRAAFWTAAHVGRVVWVLPQIAPTGNEGGPRVVTGIVSAREAVLGGAPFVANEPWTAFVVKNYDYSGIGYPAADHDPDEHVFEASRGVNAIDRLRRSLQLRFAEGSDLDALGRREGVDRLRNQLDWYYRRLVGVMSHLPRQTVYALELVLDALFPEGGWEIYQDRVTYPNRVYLTIPSMNALTEFRGKAFLPVEEPGTSTDATHVTAADAPTTVQSVTLQDRRQDTETTVLPSAAPDPWTYVNEGAVEGAVFSILPAPLTMVLQQDQSGGNPNGGRYRKTLARLPGEVMELAVTWSLEAIMTAGGHPWQLIITDGSKEYAAHWSDTAISLGQSTGVALATAAWSPAITNHPYRLALRVEDGQVRLLVDGAVVLQVPASSFGADATKTMSFGYVNNGANQNWVCRWQRPTEFVQNRQNFWNLQRSDGVLAGGGSTHMTSAAGLFLAAHENKHIRITGVDPRNDELWGLHFVAAGDIQLQPIVRADGAIVTTETIGAVTYNLIRINEPRFNARSVGKSVVIAGSTEVPTNNGTYPVIEFIDPWTVRVTRPLPFVTEGDLDWSYAAVFGAEVAVHWELVDVGSLAGAVLTLADALPAAVSSVVTRYSTVLSGQLLREAVNNTGVAPLLYYPAYLADADADLRQMIEDDVLAAGKIPIFQSRPW